MSDCGSNSCAYAQPPLRGMRTNGPCSCPAPCGHARCEGRTHCRAIERAPECDKCGGEHETYYCDPVRVA